MGLPDLPLGMSHSYNVVPPLQFCGSHRGTADRFRRYSNGSATVRNLHLILLIRKKGPATHPADLGGDRMILWLFSIVGVVVGVIATGTSIPDSEAMMLLGISIIGVAICLRRGKSMRD